MKLRQTVIGGVLLVSAIASHALSIGRVRGAAWIGQALDVTVPVRLEQGEDASSLCFDADVFHADTRVDTRNVQILTDSQPAAAGGREISVRVRSNLIVDEPVVTIYLRVGCEQKVTRRLVLLADIPTETSSALNVAPLPVAPLPQSGIAGVPPAPRAPAAPAPAPAAASTPAPAAASTPGPARPAAAPRPARPRPPAVAAAPAAPRVGAPASAPAVTPPAARAPAPAPAAAAPAAPRSRLQLDPAEPLPDRDTGLRSSATLSTTPVEDEARRAEAAAIWRSINSQPEDLQRDSQRLQEMEKSLLALRSQMMANQTSLTDLKAQLEQAQNERYMNPLVYALAALLLLALAGLAFVWRRGQRTSPQRGNDWWRDVDHRSPNTVQVAPAGPIPGITEPPVPRHRSTTTVQMPASQASAVSDELDLDLGFDNPESVLVQHDSHENMVFHPAPLPRRMNTDFHSSFGGSGRSVNTEELFDIHQQADFFTSLGQHEQAIGVLLGHIRENPETSALAYLDLFRIYHQQNRRAEFDKLRDEFHAAFNAEVPEFDAFNETGRGLEAYAETLQRVQELWGSPDGITLIEELIFRRPARAGEGQAFDLEAYRELLLLFAVALEVAEGDDDFVLSGTAPGPAFAVMGSAAGPLTVPPGLGDELPPSHEASVSLPPLPDLDATTQGPAATAKASAPAGPAPAVGGQQPVGIDFVLSDSMVAPLSSLPTPASKPPTSVPLDNGIDFELFDPSTEAELDPAKRKK